MNNILPIVSKAATSARVEESFFSDWKRNTADPKIAVIPSYLVSEFTPDPEELKLYRDDAALPKREPNFVDPATLKALDPSPLSNETRGLPDPIGPIILAAKHIFSLDKSTYKPPKPEKIVDLVICVENRLLSGVDIFMQRSGSIKNFRLKSYQKCFRSLTGSQPSLGHSNNSDSLYILCSTAKRSTVVTTSRQEIKTFTFFTDSKIGLEVEMMYGRLVVGKVLPDTQAAPMELQLDGGEILAVNSQRVVDLDEFQEAMVAAKEFHTVELLMASYKGGRGKQDDMYLFDLQKSQGMKSVLSNLFMNAHHGSKSERVGTASSADTEEEKSLLEDDKTEQSEVSGSKAEDKIYIKELSGSKLERAESKLDADSVVSSVADSKASKPKKKKKYIYDSESDEENPEEEEEDEEKEELIDKEGREEDNNSILYMDDEGGMMVQKKTSTVQLEIKQNREVQLEEDVVIGHELDMHSQGDESSQDDWNHLTTTNVAESKDIVPYVSLTCLPNLLMASKKYGRPKHFVQFTNFSSLYILEVNWVDEDGTLIQRANIAAGQTHFELASDEHVWMLAAKPQQVAKMNKSVYSTSTGASLRSLHASTSTIHNVGYDNDKPVPIVIIHPSPASLSQGKCVSMLWTPFSSLSVTQTVYTLTKKEAVSNTRERVMPCIHLQLLDPPSNLNLSSTDIYADENRLGKLLRKPLTKTRVLNKTRKTKMLFSNGV